MEAPTTPAEAPAPAPIPPTPTPDVPTGLVGLPYAPGPFSIASDRAPHYYIDVFLPQERSYYGILTLQVRGSWNWLEVLRVYCYAMADKSGAVAHGNPQRDPAKPFGDTPTGWYNGTIARFAPGQIKDPETLRSKGPYGYVALTATPNQLPGRALGKAWEAQLNGRYGILIHSGDLSPHGFLRPTYGCIRLGNEDLKTLLSMIPNLKTITVIVNEFPWTMLESAAGQLRMDEHGKTTRVAVGSL